MKRAILLGSMAAAALLAGCATQRETFSPPVVEPTVDPNSPLAAPTYMAMAASGDQFEIQSSQLALQMSQNPALRSFAQMLINDHTRLSGQMVATAQSAGLTPPPPMLLPQHQQMLDQLRAAPPGAFDESYRNIQVAAHQQALALHQNYASGGDHPALRAVAAQAVPIIQAHLSQAQSLQVAPPPPPPPPPSYQPPSSAGERG